MLSVNCTFIYLSVIKSSFFIHEIHKIINFINKNTDIQTIYLIFWMLNYVLNIADAKQFIFISNKNVKARNIFTFLTDKIISK